MELLLGGLLVDIVKVGLQGAAASIAASVAVTYAATTAAIATASITSRQLAFLTQNLRWRCARLSS